MILAKFSRVTLGYGDSNNFTRARKRPLRNYPSFCAHLKGEERYISLEHTIYANTLIREYREDLLTDEHGAARKLNSKLLTLGKDKNKYEVVFLTFRKLLEYKSTLPNAHMITTVIAVAGKYRLLEEAKYAFNWSRSEDAGSAARPTSYTYTAMMQAIGQNITGDSWREAFRLFDEMLELGLTPNTFTYSALIRTGVRGGENGARQALSLIPYMQERGVVPDLAVASALVSAFGAVKNTSGVRTAARSALCLGNVDGRLFVEIIRAYVLCGLFKDAIEIFESPECPKNVQTCTAIMQAYGESGCWRAAENIYKKMKIDTSDGGFGFLPNARAHTTLLNIYEKALLWDRAILLLRNIEHLSITNKSEEYCLNEIHYNVVLSACGKCGKWSIAEALFHAMRSRGIRTTCVTFSTLMIAYGRSGEIERARHLFALMENESVCADDYCFVGLIIGYAKSRNLRAALEIKQLMVASNVKETVHTYNALIYVADVCGEYEKVVDLYETMLRNGIRPNLSTQALVVNVGKKGAKFYEDTQLAASVASAAAGIVGVVGMALGRW